MSEGDLAAALTGAQETAYRWNIVSDELVWAANASDVLRISVPTALANGAGYALLIDPDYVDARFDAIKGSRAVDNGAGVAYCVQYRLKPDGRQAPAGVWIEEQGRWYAGADGRPARAEGVMRAIDERYEHEQRLIFLSRYDELTGQMNRLRLTEAIGELMDAAEKGETSGALVMAGVNNLAHLNETYGFDIGDEVIGIVGRRLKHCLRGRDCIGRYGSNKFGMVLWNCGQDQLERIAARLIETVGDSVIETSAGALTTTVRLGGVLFPEHAHNAQEAINHALEALEWAGPTRSGCYAIYSPSEKRESQRKKNMAIANDVVSALNERRMTLALQPVVANGTRETAFYECLLRMREPDGTVVNADKFIPVAEQLGLSRLVDHRVLELTIETLKARPDLKLAMNVSGQTATDSEWLDAVRAQTAGDRSLTERLLVEITETAAIMDIEESVGFVESLKKLGCRVAIDDFGAGYTSFLNLRRLDIDMIKIDGAFVRDLTKGSDDWVFIRVLLDLARNFKLETVAEWVESEPAAQLLEEAGITYMQGFYFGVPELVGSEQDEAAPRETRQLVG